ncbi:MAG TPA: BatD family protein [Bacteroidia bacterium]
MQKRVNIFFLFLLSASTCFAQPKLEARVSKKNVAVGEQFRVSFVINAGVENFKGPPFADFNVLLGPVSSYSSNVNFNTGQSIEEVSFTYVLSANKEGTLTIEPASVTIRGKVIKSAPVTIEVSKNPQANNPNNGSSSVTSNGETMFLRTVVSRQKCYQGEYLLVTHKVYAHDAIIGFRDLDYPAYDGFWSQVIEETKQNIQLTKENIDGKEYFVAVLRQAVLFPQRSGSLEIKPMSVEMVVRQKGKGTGDPYFDSFFGVPYKDVNVKVKGTSAKVEVTPLPGNNKPVDFLGSVGTYALSAKIDKEKVKTNDAINLSLTISGKGNLKLVSPPRINLPEEIETYDPKSVDNISVGATGMNGSRTFEYVLIPRHSGEYKINVAPFSFFDPEKRSYVTLNSPEFSLQVEKNGNEKEEVVISPTQKQDVQEIASDIRYIKTDLGSTQLKGDHFFGSPVFWTFTSLPPALFFLFVLLRRKKLSEELDVVSAKSRRAAGTAKKRLALANKHLQNGNKDLFYEEVLRGVNAYISERVNIPVADLSRDNISAMLSSRHVPAGVIDQLLSIINTCEFARYAPSGSAVEMGNMYNDALEAIIKTEETLS